jgi:hypothetical protein
VTGKTNLPEFFSTKTTDTTTSTSTAKPTSTTKGAGQPPAVGDTYHFGPYDWRVLDVQNGKALLITKDIVEERAYYNEEWVSVTWETCTLRKYLNGTFYESFSEADRARIVLKRNENPDNTWGRTQGKPFGTPGGNPTDDHIFLLSVAEILKYFPGLKLHKDSDGDEWWYEADERLVARFNNSGFWWWLRSPGYNQHFAASVLADGYVYLDGSYVYGGGGGVRPALWLNL